VLDARKVVRNEQINGIGTHSGVNLGVVFGELENFARVLRPMWAARELADERFAKVVICVPR
jgi:hypothetical protein